jgi:hypothetical protein
MSQHRVRGAMIAAAAVLSAFSALSCAGAPPPGAAAGATEPPAAGAERATADTTSGRGFLDREDVTVRMAGDGLIIDVIPMNPEVLGLATDDLRVYLQEALKKVPETVPPDIQRRGVYFLVGFSATEKEISFEPSRVELNSEGRRYYPLYIVPISAGFERKVLEIFSAPVWAVYIYEPGIDLVSTLEFAYGDASTGGDWRRVVQNIEEARGRATAE